MRASPRGRPAHGVALDAGFPSSYTVDTPGVDEYLWPVEEHPRDPQKAGLQTGCYLARLTPYESNPDYDWHFDGTLRVQSKGQHLLASGDLYIHVFPMSTELELAQGNGWPEPDPSKAVVPIFPHSAHAYYVAVRQLIDDVGATGSFRLVVDMLRLRASTRRWIPDESYGVYWADMFRIPGPPGYPHPDEYFEGDLIGPSGYPVGSLTLGRVSDYLRRATVEIDHFAGTPVPEKAASGLDWPAIFKKVDWQVDCEVDETIPPADGQELTRYDLHEMMLSWRNATNLDTEWRYHLLCAPKIQEPRGVMYDVPEVDANHVPREGAAVESDDVFPDDANANYRGKSYGSSPDSYFRTAVHEIGHAMGLDHNTLNYGLMNTTDYLYGDPQFPQNIDWDFQEGDQRRLCHDPDPFVRPGGTPFEPYIPSDARSAQQFGGRLRLDVAPIHEEPVPLGAPVRLELTLRNDSSETVPVPRSLSLSRGYVHGRVIDAAGTVRTCRSLNCCREERSVQDLESGGAVEGHAVTLLRGTEGALFPHPGRYLVEILLTWQYEGTPTLVAGTTHVFVAAARKDAKHRALVQQLLDSKDLLYVLVFGGRHLREGVRLLQRAKRDKVLGPHYAFIEAKRLTHLGEASKQMLDGLETAVMTSREKAHRKRFYELIRRVESSGLREALEEKEERG